MAGGRLPPPGDLRAWLSSRSPFGGSDHASPALTERLTGSILEVTISMLWVATAPAPAMVYALARFLVLSAWHAVRVKGPILPVRGVYGPGELGPAMSSLLRKTHPRWETQQFCFQHGGTFGE